MLPEFNYTFKWVDDGAYGYHNKDTGEWNGLMGELLSQVGTQVYSWFRLGLFIIIINSYTFISCWSKGCGNLCTIVSSKAQVSLHLDILMISTVSSSKCW